MKAKSYATTDYNYDYMKSSGTDAVIASLGVGFPVVKSTQPV